MENKEFAYKKRIVDEELKDLLESSGAVLIEGPKWCGKTTTASQFANSVIRMDEPSKRESNIQMVDINPSQILNGENPRLIDEWQIAPKLWDATRHEIDSRRKQGQFILTGSSVPIESQEITHSGTGRFSWLTMRTMSLYESLESTGEVSLKELFNSPLKISGFNKLDINSLAYLICRGGWPESLNMAEKPALKQAYNYLEGVIKSDINRADGTEKNPQRVRTLLKSYARYQGAQIDNIALKKDILTNDKSSINEDTVLSYINALKKIFVVEEMEAWNPNLRSKTAIRTSNTRYYGDPSIAAASLRIGPDDLLNDLNTFGLLFETMCVRDLRIYANSLDGDVFHYRDKSGLECDAVVHLRNGKYGLVEIKLGGDHLIEEGCKNLKSLSDKIDTTKMLEPSFMMILTGVGDYAYRRNDGIYIVPVGCLKN